MIPDYTADDIRAQVSHNAFRLGDAMHADGMVLNFEEKNGRLHAQVKSSGGRNLYRQTISFGSRSHGRLAIQGGCTCPMSYNCKHIAAVLLEGLEQKSLFHEPPETPEAAMARRVLALAGKPAAAGKAPAEGLPRQYEAWLAELAAVEDRSREDYPEDVSQRIVYVFAAGKAGDANSLVVTPYTIRLLKSGGIGSGARPANIDTILGYNPGRSVRPVDVAIMTEFTRGGPHYVTRDFVFDRPARLEALQKILATGRARWLEPAGPALSEGPPLPGRITWKFLPDATLQPQLEADGPPILLKAWPPVYVAPDRGHLGLLETGHAPGVAYKLLGAPPLPAQHAGALAAEMVKRAPRLAAAAPAAPPPARRIAAAPQPRLRLMRGLLPPDDPAFSHFNRYEMDYLPRESVGLARLRFNYDGFDVALGETRDELLVSSTGELAEITRDRAAENKLIAVLLASGLAPVSDIRIGVPEANARDFMPEDGDDAWLDAMFDIIPALKAQGWRIDQDQDFPYRLVRPDGDIEAGVREGSGIDWFDFDLGVTIDGARVDLVPAILALINKPDYDPQGFAGEAEEAFYLPLPDGRVLALPAGRIAPIVAALYELSGGFAPSGEGIRLSLADAAGLADFEAAVTGLGVVWRGGERIREMGALLRASGGIPPVTLPDTFKAELRPYQAQGVAWLQFLRQFGLGGILADDMGLGKTVQALALIAMEKAAGRLDKPALVVAPTSLMANWRGEAEKFAPDLKVLTLQGMDRHQRFADIPGSDIVLSTYPLMTRDHEELKKHTWHIAILDEAQTIKNPEATTAKLISGIEARHRFCLTGTPLENHLGELWSLFSFAQPGFLYDRKTFTSVYRTPIEKLANRDRARQLAKRVKPFMLRRNKSEVAGELPPKTEIAERIELDTAQRNIYEAIRIAMHARVQQAIAEKGFSRSRIEILTALLKLRQACCDPRLLKIKSAEKAGSAKLERLMELVTELLAEGRRILLFSQFTSMLDLIRPELDKVKVPYALLTGDTVDRPKEIARFQKGEVPVFLLSLKAGGTGLNLTAADTVIVYDPWWNPAVEEQAIDRAHRIGQLKPVFVHRLVAVGTIEEKMEVLKDKKRHLAQSIFDHEGEPTLAMTEDDLNALLG